jgi:nucleoside-diphosphate kinase
MELTFAIIKPDAVERRLAGQILARIEAAGFTVKAMRLQHLTRREAEGFYAVHRERPFFGELTAFMSSGPCVLLALEAPDAIRKWRAPDAIRKWRDTMGATDPAKADAGTLRKDFGESIGRNATHGSDAPDTAAFELGYFFRGMEIV